VVSQNPCGSGPAREGVGGDSASLIACMVRLEGVVGRTVRI